MDDEVRSRPVVRVTDGGSRRPGSGLRAVVPRIQHAKHSGDSLLGGYGLRQSQGYRRRHARQQFRQEQGATNGVDTASVAVVVVVGVVEREGALRVDTCIFTSPRQVRYVLRRASLLQSELRVAKDCPACACTEHHQCQAAALRHTSPTAPTHVDAQCSPRHQECCTS